MNKTFLTSGLFFGLLLLFSIESRAEIREADDLLARQVFKQLLTVVPPNQKLPWPPDLIIVDKEDINAYASIEKKDAQVRPVVVCYNGLLQKVVEGNADRIAYVLGHELAHHILGHTQTPKENTDFLRATFGRDQELEADREGMQLAAEAGYSFNGGLGAIRKMIDLGLNYSSFEGLSSDHPSWYDRITQLDKQQTTIWRSLSAFQNGTFFLVAQNYVLAQRAFGQVTKAFPDADEAWANLGYAMLMEYADSLDESDLQHFNVGQIVAGGFYRRSKSLEARVRGVNEELWWDAVGALREAIRLNPSLSLPRANLGIAYLFRPAGKDPGKATQYLEEAANLAPTDPSLDPISRIAESANLAVAYAAAGDNSKASEMLSTVDRLLQAPTIQSSRAISSVKSAVAYNRAFLLAQSTDKNEQKLAFDDLQGYLRSSDPSGMWWKSAYDKYADLSRIFGISPQPVSLVHGDLNLHFRPVTELEINSLHVALGDPMAKTKSEFTPAPSVVPVIPKTNLLRFDFDQLGISLIGSDEILAIVLSGKYAPSISVREAGVGNRSHKLSIGMSTKELDQLMQDSDYDFRQLADPKINYRFYKDVGIAVLVRDGLIAEIVISQIPKDNTGLI
jgi:tetratricopeptide (TPR) repeat protein